jgi:hypothetical protein
MKPDSSYSSAGGNSLSRALSRWKSEGGSSKSADLKNQAQTIEDEDRILECLGVALIKVWDDLPRDIQRNLFAAASEVEESAAPGERKEHIARFLHNYAN